VSQPRTCVVVELVDGSLHAYVYPDKAIAESVYDECREEWNAGRTLVFNLRRQTVHPFAAGAATHAASPVTAVYGPGWALLELRVRGRHGVLLRGATRPRRPSLRRSSFGT
jgi:hypothetical protein